MTSFFRLPELLLIIAMLAEPVIVGNTAFAMLLALTWLAHLLCRKYGLMRPIWRWIQVGLTIVPLAMVVFWISVVVLGICRVAKRRYA
jgi:hypothetical protein